MSTAPLRVFEGGAFTPPHVSRQLEDELAHDVDVEEEERSRFRLISAAAMENLPKPEWLKEDRLTRGGLSALVGAPGCGKTFLALDDSLSIADESAPAVYVAAEGSAGLGARIRAWKMAHHAIGAHLPVYFITEPVAIANPSQLTEFLIALTELGTPPSIVTIDTLARCMIGLDENSTADMSAFIAGADSIRRATGAHVQLLHHMNAGGERERGNTALRGACDTMMFLKADGDELTLSCEKQKDAAPFEKVRYRLTVFGDSAALVTANGRLQYGPNQLTAKQLEVLSLLQTHFTESNPPTTTEWQTATGWDTSKMRTFYNARTALVKGGYVTEPKIERGGRYTITEEGRLALTAWCK